VADFLSRHPLPTGALDIATPDVLALQKADPSVAAWRAFAASHTWPTSHGPRPRETDFLALRDGLLVLDDGRPRTVAPAALVPRILAAAHDHLLAGHRGVDATMQAVAQEFWWPALPQDALAHRANAPPVTPRRPHPHSSPSRPVRPPISVCMWTSGVRRRGRTVCPSTSSS
jgi:hypothetical protein